MPLQPSNTRRSGPRAQNHLPVAVRMADNTLRAVRVRDMSAGGLAVLLGDASLAPSSRVEVVISVPYEISLTETLELRIPAEVLRVENQYGGQAGPCATALRFLD